MAKIGWIVNDVDCVGVVVLPHVRRRCEGPILQHEHRVFYEDHVSARVHPGPRDAALQADLPQDFGVEPWRAKDLADVVLYVRRMDLFPVIFFPEMKDSVIAGAGGDAGNPSFLMCVDEPLSYFNTVEFETTFADF